MTEWSVLIDVAAPDPGAPGVDADAVVEFAAVLDDLEGPLGPVGSSDGPRYGARFNVEAPTASEALAEGEALFRKAADLAGLPSWPVVEAQVQTYEELQRQLREPDFPPVVGIAEVAEMLGVSKQRASEIAHGSRFPDPIVTLRSTPVWYRSGVETWAERWQRRPGRPRRETG